MPFKDCSTTRLGLDKVLGLELSNFARLLKFRPGVDDDQLLVQMLDRWIMLEMNRGGRSEET